MYPRGGMKMARTDFRSIGQKWTKVKEIKIFSLLPMFYKAL